MFKSYIDMSIAFKQSLGFSKLKPPRFFKNDYQELIPDYCICQHRSLLIEQCNFQIYPNQLWFYLAECFCP